MSRTIFTLFLFTTLTSAGFTAEKFVIKLKLDAKGDVSQTTETDSESGKSSFNVMGQAQAKDQQSTSSQTFKEEILEMEKGKRATRLKRIYQKAEASKDGKKLELSIVGKEILIIREGKKYQYSVDGKDLAGDDAVFLGMQFGKKGDPDNESKMEEMFFPKEAVAVNGSWKVDVDAAAKDLLKDTGITVDLAKSSGSGKLTKAYIKDGRQFGLFEIEMTLALSKLGMGAMAMDLDANSKTKLTFSFDVCIDGSSRSGEGQFAMQMKMAGVLKTADGKEIKIDVAANGKKNKSVEDLSAKK